MLHTEYLQSLGYSFHDVSLYPLHVDKKAQLKKFQQLMTIIKPTVFCWPFSFECQDSMLLFVILIQ